MGIDCKITENFLKAKARMCAYRNRPLCHGCDLKKGNNGTVLDCEDFLAKCPEKAIEIVQDWADLDTYKSYKEDFLEKFPEAEIVDGYPKVRPCSVYPDLKYVDCMKGILDNSCRLCWDFEMEEDDEDW